MQRTRRPRAASHDQRLNGVFVLALALLVAVVVSGSASAAGDPPDESGGVLLPTPSDIAMAIESGESEGLPELTDPTAAEGVRLEGLQRGEAVELLNGVFGESIERAAGIYDELQEATLLSPYVAVLPEPEAAATEAPVEEEPVGGSENGAPQSEDRSAPDEGPAHPPEVPAELANASLVHSTIPLQVGGEEETLDLSLERHEGTLEPVAPLVRTRIPADLDEEIEFPEIGLSIEVAGLATERSASISGGSVAFYPNVAPDTDLAISPTPTGVETWTQLRSSDSPEASVYRFSFPDSASLTATEAGGAQVRSGGELLLNVPAPTAIDAAGGAVPVDLEVSGDTLRLYVEPDANAPLPILVDPLFQTYEWHAKDTNVGICSSSFGPTPSGDCGHQEEWAYKKIEKPWGGLWHLEASSGANSVQPGIHVRARNAQEAGNYAAAIYSVPRYYKETPAPTSYIKSLKLTDVDWEALGSYASPHLFMGIWDSSDSHWVNYYTHTGQNEHGIHDHAFPYEFSNPPPVPGNPGPSTGAKSAQISINATESTASSSAHVWVGAATVELGDQGAPSGPIPVPQTKWVNQEAPPLGFTASDTGLGVYAIKAFTEDLAPSGSPLNAWTALNGCVGVGNSACPRTWKSSDSGTQALNYQPGLLPTGISYLGLIAEDPVGNKSSTSWLEVRVDHTPPALSLSGNLTEQNAVGTNLREYTLNYTAKDGDEAAAAALTPWGTAGKAEKQLERPMDVAVAADGSAYAVDRVNNRVIKYDPEGKPVLQFGSSGPADGQFNDPRGIDVGPDGTVWVADTGNDRIQAFSPTGAFLRKHAFSDPTSEPNAIASGPGGVLWVTDIGLRRLIKLSENPITTLLTTTGKESGGSGKGLAVVSPTGVATDKSGNVWVADFGLGKVLKLDSGGKPLFQFGTGGSGDGQIDGIVGIDVSPVGHLAITERNNGRVQIFKPDGSYLRKFGSAGAGNNQFLEASGLSFGPDNTLLVADAGNKRLARWSHADKDPQSGAAKVVIKVDGTTVHSKEPGCVTKNCQVSSFWTLDADDYPGGAHKVEVSATDAVGITQTKTIDIETHGDHTDPAIALSGTMTQQASIGTTRPNYKLKAVASDPGPAAELKSGVASTAIKVDGTVVDSTSSGCPAGSCSVTREWTLNSESYSVGSHTVEVKATDAAGRVSTKTLTINIARDTTPPAVTYTGAFYSAPSGWFEQKKVGYGAYLTDSGYGVTSVELKIDGVAVNSFGQTCAAGGCFRFFAQGGETLDLAQYSGGSHPAEFIARDGAGNTVKRSWAIHIDPEGHITASEAADTLEAVEETTEGTPIAPNEELLEPEQMELGDNPEFQQDGAKITSTGVPNLTTMSTDPKAGITITSPYGETKIIPKVSEGASNTSIVEGVAGVSANATSQVDSVVRPQYNGVQTFQAIRSESSPEQYSWTIQLYAGQVLRLADSDHAEILYESGKRAFLITAEQAHDATGREVPTSFEVSGNVLTLNVEFHTDTFIYPILAGAAWETSYRVPVLVEGPEDELEILEREKAEKEAAMAAGPGSTISPPTTQAEAEAIIRDAGPEYIEAPPSPPSEVASASDSRRIIVLEKNERCHELGCENWNVWLGGGQKAEHPHAVHGPGYSEWVSGTKVVCGHHISTSYEIGGVSIFQPGCGFTGPWKVTKGSGKHLTVYARFDVSVLMNTPQLTWVFHNYIALQSWIWPNGFKELIHKTWDGGPVVT